MKVLKRNSWPIYLILNILTLGLFTFYIAYRLDLYDKNAWYFKWYYWTIGFIFGIIPGLVMLLVFSIKMACLVSETLKVPGKEVYGYPYTWIVCAIFPVLGWALFVILYIYIHIWYVFSLKDFGKN